MHISCMARKAGHYTKALSIKHLDETLFCKLKMLPDETPDSIYSFDGPCPLDCHHLFLLSCYELVDLL